MSLVLSFDDVHPDPADYQRVIRHECGHSILARFEREPIAFVRIGRSLQSETPGETQRVRLAAWCRECLIARAGETAERLFGDGTSDPAAWADDRRYIQKVLREFRAEVSGYAEGAEWLGAYLQQIDVRVQVILHRPEVRDAFDILSRVLQEKRREKEQQRASGQPVAPSGLRGNEVADLVDPLLTPPA